MFLPAMIFAAVLGGTAFYRLAAVRFGWVDHPNHRSSHSRSVPRGAGIVFACALLGYGFFGAAEDFYALLFGGLLVAVTGWLDDVRGLSSRARFIVYGAAIGVAVYAGFPDGNVGAIGVQPWLLLMAGICIAFGWLWLTNLYNFMDGINGIAAWEAIAVLLAAFLLDAYAGNSRWLAAATLAALPGFLLWNFPRARVFMGDAGSAFMGFWLGGFALMSARENVLLVVVWAILLGCFIVDATWTLLYRMLSGQSWHQPHRSHLYQRLARRWSSHVKVDVALLAVNLLWLLPWAALVRYERIDPAVGLTAAYLPLLFTCWYFGAGKRDS